VILVVAGSSPVDHPIFFRLKQPSDISCLTYRAKKEQIIVAPMGLSEVFNTSSPVIGSRAILKTK